MSNKRANALTLLELMVVIAIIVVLAGLLFPAVQSVLERAKKVQAKNDLTQIVTAVNAFYTEYGRYPTTATTDANATYGGSTSSKALFDELRAKNTSSTALNSRQIVFISPPEDGSAANPKGKIGSDGQFHDPWSSAYWVAMDADYDNQITPNPYGNNNGAGPDPIRQGAIVWSLGKNGALGGGPAASSGYGNESGTAGQFKDSGDVISWQ